MDYKLEQSMRDSPSKDEVSTCYRELITGSVDYVHDVISKKKHAEKLN